MPGKMKGARFRKASFLLLFPPLSFLFPLHNWADHSQNDIHTSGYRDREPPLIMFVSFREKIESITLFSPDSPSVSCSPT